MTAERHNHVMRELGVALAGLPARDIERLSCIHSFNSKKLRQWAEQLNVLNVSTAVPAFITVFQELAAARLGVKEIYDLYLVLRPTLTKVRAAIYAVYNKRQLQLTSQAKQAMELGHSLDRSVVVMLKGMLSDCVQIQNGTKLQRMTAMIGCHLMIYLSEISIRLNEFCISIPKGFWRECHSVYWFLAGCSCEKLELQQTEFGSYPSRVSIDRLYKGLILYAIAEPCRYDRSLQVDLFHMMVMLSESATLEEKPMQDGLFAVVPTEDLSHVPQRAMQDQEASAVLYFHMGDVVDTLQTMASRNTPLTTNERLSRLSDEFIGIFTIERFRREKRHDLAQNAVCFFGLVQIHRFLTSSGQVQNEEEEDFYSQAKGLDSSHLKSEEVVLKDESIGGYCLETIEKHRLSYGAGDLIFMPAQEVDIMCVIRWTRLQSSGKFLLGVEKLALDIDAIEFAVMYESTDSILEKGLMFDFDEQKILLSRAAMQPGQVVQIKDNDRQRRFEIAEVHWLVSGYVQTILKPLG